MPFKKSSFVTVVLSSDEFPPMADYKVHKYEPKKYSTKISIDPKVKFYEPVQSANTYKPLINRPIEQKKTELRTYDKVKKYDSYSEYVPPWSRGKEKGKKTVKEAEPPPPPPPPTQKKKQQQQQQQPPKVSFAPVTSSKVRTEQMKKVRMSLSVFKSLSWPSSRLEVVK